MKCTTTKTISFPFDFGNPSIKSIVRCIHAISRISNGSSSPGFATCSYFVTWQTGH
uniref:Uncharacterized protein n=1 Tax=Arundo donax TaxID=35708 RepID=A0A0A8Y0Q4_ARUDO